MVRCHSCGSRRVRNRGRAAPTFRPGADLFDVCECRDCGLSFSEPLPGQDVVNEFYRVAHPYLDVYGREDAGWQRVQHRLDLERIGPPRGKLLDVGCSFGLLSEVAAGMGWEVYGIEPDEDAAKVAASRIGHERVAVGFARDVPQTWGPFQAISMSHVFEHLLDFRQTLAACAELLAPGGTLAIQAPNRHSLFALRRGIDYRPIEHPFYWSYRPLFRELRAIGLQPRVAPAMFFSRSARQTTQVAKNLALAAEAILIKVSRYGIKSTLEVHATKPASGIGGA
jgi:SAM-dependent methyltransferase